MTAYFTKAISLKMYYQNNPLVLTEDHVRNTVFVNSSAVTFRTGTGNEIVPDSSVQGLEIWMRDTEKTRQIVEEGPKPEIFEFMARAEGHDDGTLIGLKGYISYFQWFETAYEDESALCVILLTTKDGIIEGPKFQRNE